ncbi:MAG: hypothetical protein Q4D96_13220 [Propionibacteriaceae bacterium]|nr:hypothetical protein [Propionibacteriaceae bacterium]
MRKLRLTVAGLAALALALTPMAGVATARADEEPPAVTTVTEFGKEADPFNAVGIGWVPTYTDKADAEALVAALKAKDVEAAVVELGEGLYSVDPVGDDMLSVAALVVITEHEWEQAPWSSAKLEQHNAWVDQATAYFKERGFEVEIVTTSHGVKYPDVKGDPDEVLDVKLDFVEAVTPDQEEPLEAPDQEADKAEMYKLVEHLRSLGFEASVEEDEHGSFGLVVDWDDVDLWIAVEEYDWENNPMTPEEIAENNKGEEALAAYLKERGFEVEVKTSKYGVKYTDYGKDEAAWKAADEFWDQYQG